MYLLRCEPYILYCTLFEIYFTRYPRHYDVEFLIILRLLYRKEGRSTNTNSDDNEWGNDSHGQLRRWGNCHRLGLLFLKVFDSDDATSLWEKAADKLAHPDSLTNCLQLVNEGNICRMFER